MKRQLLYQNENVNGIENIVPALYEKYLEEIKHFAYLTPIAEDEFKGILENELAYFKPLCAFQNGKLVGAMFYQYNEADCFCFIPVYGYYYEDEKVLGQLFEHLAKLTVGDSGCTFSVGLYAHDETAIRLYSMMQFGMMSEKCIRRIADKDNDATLDYTFKHLNKSEIEDHWQEVWKLTSAIINHLKASPVFYPCEEFTEEVYRDFYMDSDTTVHVALDEKDNLVGIIESNRSEDTLIFPEGKSVNVGEAYVVDELRGNGLAAELLQFAENYEKEQGAEFSWVEHGTANPNARGFWNKYFDTWQYEMVRKIIV